MTTAEPSENTVTGEIPPSGPPWFRRDWFLGLLLCLGIFAAYQPVWQAQFVWDDSFLVAGPNPPTIPDIWTTRVADNAPLSRTVLSIERAIWGLNPMPFHVVDVCLHALCAILLWQVLRKLQVPGAWLGAALWSLHPVQAESAAWVSETKNTLSGAFFLLAIYFFSRVVKPAAPYEGVRRRDYALALLCSALAMAGKSSTVTLPAIFCLCVWWLEREWQWRSMLKVVPVFFLSLAAGAVTFWTASLLVNDERDSVWHPEWIRPLPARIVAAGDAVWFYLGKLAWPHPVFTMYPRWEIDATRWISWLPSVAVVATLGFFWAYRNSWGRVWFFVFALFLTALLPVLGIVEQPITRYSFIFDHFQYLASIAPLALLAAGLVRLFGAAGPRVQMISTASLLTVIGILTWQRAATFEDEITFSTDCVKHNPAAWQSHNNLGIALSDAGRPGEAIPEFKEALKYNLNYPTAHNGMGVALAKEKRYNEAMEEFREASRIDPTNQGARSNLATVQNIVYTLAGPH